MDWNQWRAANRQLLSHWKRSGISGLPRANPEGFARARAWLEENSIQPFSESDRVHAAQPVQQRPTPAHVVTNDRVVAGEPASTSGLVDAQKLSGALPLIDSGNRSWLTPSLSFPERQSFFESLNHNVVACRKCTDIVCYRQRTVFGVGPNNAKIVMFGEAPGADEDRTGEPFVGAAGELLNKILAASGLRRDEVYILNALKCRPPSNRTPTPAEIENCRPFFDSQLETIQPEYIVCWGSVAVRAVLGTTESVGRLRGRFHFYRGAKVMVTYHPAYLLRNPDAKKLTWEDMKMLMRELGITLPVRNAKQ